MPALRTCSACGAGLPEDTAEGLCPQCLLRGTLPGLAEAVQVTGADVAALTADWGSRAVPTPAELARYFPALEILSLLGRGGMGAVYKARQTRLDRLVALKILPPEAGRDPAFAERFTREARTLARLNHPNIVAVHDFGESDGLYYFLMEFVDGGNLRQVLGPGTSHPREALRLGPQVCAALQYAHEEGVVHRDVKPENILLDSKGRVKVADFGLARLLGDARGDRLTGTYQVMGTLHYMAPEQVERPLTVDQRADIYSLGVVLYELLTGELPLGRFPLPSRRGAIDPRLDDVVLRALEKDPGQRYQHAGELGTALQSIASLSVPTVAAVPAAAVVQPAAADPTEPIRVAAAVPEEALTAVPSASPPSVAARLRTATTVVAAVLCLLGTVAVFLPWSTTFAATGEVTANGLYTWHGQVAVGLFLVLGVALLAVGRLEGAYPGRALALLGTGAAVVGLMIVYMDWALEPRPVPLPMDPARSFQNFVGMMEKVAPEMRGGISSFDEILSLPGKMKQPGHLLAGSYLALAGAIGLLVLGAIQLRLAARRAGAV